MYLDVRSSYRGLIRSRKSSELSVKSVSIAERRRRLAVLQQKQGQASARDVLEAEESLRNAQNSLTGSIISYKTTRLRFLASLGMIGADEKGVIYERPVPVNFERIENRYHYINPGNGTEHDESSNNE